MSKTFYLTSCLMKGMDKRERVIRTLELEEVDMVPIHYLGVERSGTAFMNFCDSDEAEKAFTIAPGVGDITIQRFLNVDCWASHPFRTTHYPKLESPKEHPDCTLNYSGSLHKKVIREKTGVLYTWFMGGYFRKKEQYYDLWEKHGRPIEHLVHKEDFTRKKWDTFVENLAPYYYPLPPLGHSIFTTLSDSMGLDRIAYYMRKDPAFIHELFGEYGKVNIEIINLLHEAGADTCFYFDDLGQKDRGLLSVKNFRTFLLPVYKKMYDTARKHEMFMIQHSCGNVLEFLPDMVDAGLSCIQALEPASGINLADVKAKYGGKLALMGGMDSSRILNFGTAQEIQEHVKWSIESAAPGGGYFAGPSHDILDVPWENLLIFRDALEKYRRV
jgi:Uroporphyrinogen decarboxylase (URO-D)